MHRYGPEDREIWLQKLLRFLNAIPKFRQWVTKLAAPKTNQEKRKAGRTNPLRKSDGR